MTPGRSLLPRILLWTLLIALVPACVGAGVDDPADAGPAADGSGPDGGAPSGSELIEAVDPPDGAEAPRNATVHIDFRSPVAPETLLVEVDGVPVTLSSLDDQRFRFVPLPFFEAGAEVSVTVVAGVEDLAGTALENDLSWTFHTSAESPEVDGDPTLDDDEVALVLAGAADEPMDLVQDWADPASALYEISPPLDPTSAEAQHLVARMMVSVSHHGGIGLAAPQVGVNRRLFVADVGDGFEAFLNPVLLDHSPELDAMVEGCLSVPGDQMNVLRPTWIEIAYETDDGTPVDLRRIENPPSPFVHPARVWLHEFDHLNGILITDRQTSI